MLCVQGQDRERERERERERCVWYAPNFSLSGNAPGGAFCPIFVLKNAPGALFQNCLWSAPGGVYSVLYGSIFAYKFWSSV